MSDIVRNIKTQAGTLNPQTIRLVLLILTLSLLVLGAGAPAGGGGGL